MEKKQAKALLRNLNIAPRKVRLVASSLRGAHVQNALAQLDVMPQRSAKPLSKLIRSAMANAKVQDMNVDTLFIKTIRVDKGISLKRAKARARGRATIIEKKMSHIILELEEADHVAKPKFEVKTQQKKEKKPKEEKSTQSQKPKFEETTKGKRKEEKGFGKKTFRRKSI